MNQPELSIEDRIAKYERIDSADLWKQYKIHVDLYKSHLDLFVKFNLFYYAVTGGILANYFNHESTSLIKLSLIFPVIMSGGFAWLTRKAAHLIKPIESELTALVKVLQFESPAEIKFLKAALNLAFWLLIIIAIIILTFASHELFWKKM